MRATKGGFTLIEVSLFLAITGLLFLGVTIGVQNSIYQQRYNDSVQNFIEFLRTAYSKTENVQRAAGGGNTNEAIYGKLITFGEKTSDDSNDNDMIYMYDVIGKANCAAKNGVLSALRSCGLVADRSSMESYTPKWSAGIENTEGGRFVGAVLITRHPQTGTVYTNAMLSSTIQINDQNGSVSLTNYLGDESGDGFKSAKVDFCINPNGVEKQSTIKADVRIKKDSSNSSGVEQMPDTVPEGADSDYHNLCKGAARS